MPGHTVPATARRVEVAALFACSAAAALAAMFLAFHSRAIDGTANPQELLATAFAAGDLDAAHVALVRGARVDTPIPFTHGDLTGGDLVHARPLVIAAATGDEHLVRLLLTHGAEGALGAAPVAVCAAEAQGREQIRAMLAALLPPGDQPTCRKRRRARPILLEYQN